MDVEISFQDTAWLSGLRCNRSVACFITALFKKQTRSLSTSKQLEINTSGAAGWHSFWEVWTVKAKILALNKLLKLHHQEREQS